MLPITRYARFLFAAVLLVASGACSPDALGPTTPPAFARGGAGGPVVRVDVTPRTNVLRPGWTQQLTVRAYDANNIELTDVAFKWKSDNPAIATVSKTGLLKALTAGGPVTISAQTNTKQPVRGDAAMAVLSDNASLVAGGAGGTGGYACARNPISGTVYCWGSNSFGELGNAGANWPQPANTPGPIAGGVALLSLTGGALQGCGLAAGGQAYCWGSNASGEAGTGAPSYAEFTPAPVTGGFSFTGLAVNSRGSHNCGIDAGGHAYCWGYNGSGQLGDGSNVNRPAPTPVQGGLLFTSLAVGGTHTCGLTAAGIAYCWGEDQYGQLGDGTGPLFTDPPYRLPTPQLVQQGGLRFVSLTAGREHTCALTTTGLGYCWGKNYYYQLGDPSGGHSGVPVPVAGGNTYLSLLAGDEHTCGLTFAGAAYCFGFNATGQVGDGSYNNSLPVTPVAGGIIFRIIAPGGEHTCGQDTLGQVYCWGSNLVGQLGDGTFVPHYTPAVTLPIGP